jgi:nucleotide-binding universal stress UspA family protein
MPALAREVAMNAKVILLPTDFSPMAEHALEVASSLATENGGSLVILHVEKTPRLYDGEIHNDLAAYAEELRKSLDEVLPTEPGVPFRHKLLFGDPAETILRTADEVDADLIVMGTHGRTGVSRLMMGSVAEVVVRRASCPVLTVKERSAIDTYVAALTM